MPTGTYEMGFWTNLEPVTRFGGAHFQTVRNEVQGIGTPTFDNHAALGLNGARTQGFAMMYDFHIRNTATAPNALAHEFAHRWVVRLQPMPDGRTWGGGHFICRVDQQGGAHGQEWHGTDPAVPRSARRNFDTGDRHSLLVLYLAGYVTAAEMDAGMSEQRYMDDIDPNSPELPCLGNYRGAISPWDSLDIIATNGPRIPAADSPEAQHDFTVAWVLFHEPGQVPPERDVSKLVRTTERFHEDWVGQTLGRGTLNGQLFPDADCDGILDPGE